MFEAVNVAVSPTYRSNWRYSPSGHEPSSCARSTVRSAMPSGTDRTCSGAHLPSSKKWAVTERLSLRATLAKRSGASGPAGSARSAQDSSTPSQFRKTGTTLAWPSSTVPSGYSWEYGRVVGPAGTATRSTVVVGRYQLPVWGGRVGQSGAVAASMRPGPIGSRVSSRHVSNVTSTARSPRRSHVPTVASTVVSSGSHQCG
jgi:hypothetical protein